MKNEDLSYLNLPDAGDVNVSFFGEGGQIISDEKSALAKVAICTYDHEHVSTQHFIMFGRGEIIDPYQADSGYNKKTLSRMYKYKKVSSKCFDSYLKYLQTKNRIHFTNARRIFMEKN